jgi:hypothetical protein
MEWSSSHPQEYDWISSDEEIGWSNGESITYDLLISKGSPNQKNLSKEDIAYISKKLNLHNKIYNP